MDVLSSVLRAVADPTRRTILELLQEESRSVSDLAQHFSMSRPAVSKHLGLLREAKLVSSSRQGRQQIYELEAAALTPVREWLAERAPVARGSRAVPAATPPPRPTRRVADRGGDDWRCW